MQTVRIGFRFIDASGAVSGDGIADIPPGEAISGFLSGAPFHGPTNAESTFAFDATLPVLAAALGGETNSRGGFIMSERPVFDPGVSPPPERRWVPLVARGGGWTTDVVLVNTTGQATSGRVALRFPSDPQPELEFEYLIPAGAARRIAVQSTDPTPRLGFARVDPDPGALLPEAYADVRQTTAGTPTGATSVRASPPVDSVRILVQSAGLEGTIGAVRQAVGLVSTGGEEQIVAYALRAADGSATPWSGQLPVPANGYVAMFVHQMPGLEAVPDDFTGTLVIDAPDAAIAAIGLRARWNTAGDFVFTANGPLDTLPSNAAFPYFAIGGGYRTRFVLLSDASGVSGEIDFRGADGRSLAPPFEGSVTGTGAFSVHSPARAR
jgi:hypothetical protein